MSLHFTPPHWAIKLTCGNHQCKERARIRLGRVFTVFVNGPHGRNQKQPAFACKKCGRITSFRQDLLPKGAFATLPDRLGQMAGFARMLAHRNLRGSGDGWVRGPAARECLTDALIRTDRLGAYCALTMQNGEVVEKQINLRGLSTSRALDQLDQANCHILVSVHIDKAGRQRAMAFHEVAGCAEL